MSYKSKVFAPTKVELSHGYWAQVRPMRMNEAREVGDALSTPEGQSAGLVKLLTTTIVEWNLDDDDGKILPIDDVTVSMLSTTDQVRLVRVANDLNTPAKPEAAA